MTESIDTNAHRILGWLKSSNCGNSDGAESPGTASVALSPAAAAYSSDPDENDFEELHRMTRTTGEGFEDFRRAARILLSSDQSRIQFVPGDATETTRDPFLIVRGYFRLMRLALEPIPMPADGTPLPVSEDDLLRMALSLLKQLGTNLKSSIQAALNAVAQNKPETSPAIDSSRRNKTILYFLENSLRYIHPHILEHVKLLGPTYRLFCDISEAFISMLKFEKVNLENIASNFESIVELNALKCLSLEMDKLKSVRKMTGAHLRSAVINLLGFLDDGLTNLQSALLSCSGSSDGCVSISISSPGGQSKIIIFLLARVTSLICAERRCRVCTKTSIENKGEFEEGQTQLMNEALLRLIQIRGLSAAATAVLAGNNCHESNKPLFEMTAGLGVSTEKYFEKLLELSEVENRVHSDVTFMGMECLIDLTSHDIHCRMATANRQESERFESLMFADPLPLGTLFLKTYLLKNLFPPFLPYHESMTMNRSQSTALLKLCESILFADIPACHQYLTRPSFFTSKCNPQNWATNLLSDCIMFIEHSTHVFFIPMQSISVEKYFTAELIKKSVKLQHKLLISWLAETPSKNTDLLNKCSPNHPLTNEIILETIYRRITSSLISSAEFAKHDSLSLASMTSQLFFHCRTATPLRRNISTLLIRILLRFRKFGVDNRKFCFEVSLQDETSLVQRIWQQLFNSSLWKSHAHYSSKVKSGSKRKHSLKPKIPSCGYSMDDLLAIIPVLEALSHHLPSNTSYDVDGKIRQQMNCYWKEVLTNTGTESSANDDNFLKTMICTYLSTGALNTSSTMASFLLRFARSDENSTISDPCNFLDGVLAHIERQLNGAIIPHTRRALVRKHAFIHFLGSLALFKGVAWSESQVRRAANILVKIHDVALLNRSHDSIQLIHSIVRSASNMGCIMRSEFSKETLQPLIDSINKVLGRSKWFYVAPTVSNLEHFLRALPPNHRGLMPTSMPAAARVLLTSRMKGHIHDVTCEEKSDGQCNQYLLSEEHLYLLWICSRKAESCLGNRTLYLAAGSNVLVPRGNSGGILAVVVTEAGETSKTPQEIITCLHASRCDVHKMKSSGEIWICDE